MQMVFGIIITRQ